MGKWKMTTHTQYDRKHQKRVKINTPFEQKQLSRFTKYDLMCNFLETLLTKQDIIDMILLKNPSKRIESSFALLDILGEERFKLEKHFENSKGLKIPVIIQGGITGQWGHDDGTSIEFTVEVHKVIKTNG